MGEYAMYQGRQIKIGTCENLYYLRADQRGLVEPLRGNVDPTDPAHLREVRFRFPFPDEDTIAPGQFELYGRSVAVPGVVPKPTDLDHYSVQFSAAAGYLVSLPCPEAGGVTPYTVHRNGFAGAVHISQQGFRDGVWALMLTCGGCQATWRCPTKASAIPVIEACLREAERRREDNPRSSLWWTRVGQRIADGYAFASVREVGTPPDRG